MKEIACLEIEGFIRIAWGVSSTDTRLRRRGETSGRGFREVTAAHVHITYVLDIHSSFRWTEFVERMSSALV